MSLGVKVKSPFLLDTWTTWRASLPLSAGIGAMLVALLSAEDMESAPPARRREVVVREVISCIIAEFTFLMGGYVLLRFLIRRAARWI